MINALLQASIEPLVPGAVVQFGLQLKIQILQSYVSALRYLRQRMHQALYGHRVAYLESGAVRLMTLG